MAAENDGGTDLAARRQEYLQKLRGMYRAERRFGFVGVAAGAVLLVWGKLSGNAPHWTQPIGWGLLTVGWGIFIYVVIARMRWARANRPASND